MLGTINYLFEIFVNNLQGLRGQQLSVVISNPLLGLAKEFEDQRRK
jgi:hypothetical protein